MIVNHSLLLSDVVTGNQVLPEYRHLIVDEAHHLEDEATAQLSRRVTAREVASPAGRALRIRRRPGDAGLLAEATGALIHVGTDDEAKKDEHRRRLERGREQVVAGPKRPRPALRDARRRSSASRPGAATAARSPSG